MAPITSPVILVVEFVLSVTLSTDATPAIIDWLVVSTILPISFVLAVTISIFSDNLLLDF